MSAQPVVDGVTSPGSPQLPDAAAASVRRWKTRLTILGGAFYVVFVLWALFLLMALPADGMQGLAMVGAGTMVLGALVFLVTGFVGLMRIGRGPLPQKIRVRGMIITAIVALPGLALGALVPFVILVPPPLTITIAAPASTEELVAPVQMTFTLDRALQVLTSGGFRPVQYQWDLSGDGTVDQETVTPELTVTYDREGVYGLRVTMRNAAGEVQTATRRFVIGRSVLSILPNPVIVNRPVVLSIAHLIADPGMIVEVQWDYNGDGRGDQTTKEPQTTYTFFRTGRVSVSALVVLQNKTQARYERSFDVLDPPKLPFPVALVSEPKFLISPSPFPTLWRVDSREDIAQVLWDFGDGARAEGARVAHTFERRGTHVVEAKIFARSGSSAQLTSVVQIVDPLNLLDLSFEGTPEVQGDRIRGEVPLTLNLKPRTSSSFVQFSWEAPDATEVGSTDTTLQAIYRREGIYTVTLIGRDAENRVLRKNITVDVQPPSSLLTFQMDPETGIAPLDVRFDASETFIPNQTITGFEWDFGDSTPSRVGGARIEHRFEREGTYTVNLGVRTTSGEFFHADRTIAVRAPQLLACALASRKSGPAPLGVLFTSCSSGNVKSLLWDFGDGSQSDEPEHPYVFEKPGSYTVTLTVKDNAGHESLDSIPITVQP